MYGLAAHEEQDQNSDRWLGIAAGIGMVALHQGAVGGLDLRRTGAAGHPQHGVVISGQS